MNDSHDQSQRLERTVERIGPISTALRELLGRRVRRLWMRWARQQPNPKPSWLVPWDKLAEPDKEVDRQIGEELFLLGQRTGSQSELLDREPDLQQ